ncbi:MAG TPA: hypothetical protein VM286_01670 [Candidatus Thermoplasmatota archaeon]|nr:hypothetical protein [Candidatus Thermoplasmatota archaeon]
MSLRPMALLAVSLFVLAGCADKAPEGTLKSSAYSPPATGSIVAHYQPFTGANQASGIPNGAGQPAQCLQNQVSNPAPAGGNPQDQALPRCKGPYSTFALHADGLPLPSGSGYKLYAVGPGFEKELFAVQATDVKYAGSTNVSEDLSAKVKEIQLRMDGFTYAAVPGAEGNHTLALAPALATVTAVGTYKGHHLEVTVAGLPGNATYTGKLYVADPASPTGFTAKESFPVQEGLNTYDSAEHDISDFGEFHIHVGASALNLYKGTFEAAPK